MKRLTIFCASWCFLVWIIVFVSMLPDSTTGLPDLRENSRAPVTVTAGQEAILTCRVKNLQNNTVIWKRIKNGRPEVLTAGDLRVTGDSRFSIINSNGDTDWMLSIDSARESDSAQYVCEVNSSPIVRIFKLLAVTSTRTLPQPTPFSLAHNFTECCIMKSVPDTCLGFCSLKNIVLGTTGTTSHDCEDHLANIAFCMADGKNHEPCCIQERIPEACREVCRGEYSLRSASVLRHYACSHFSSATLACIAQGVELLPGPPEQVVVEPISAREIQVTWKLPQENGDSVTHYILNITELKAFDELEPAGDVDGPMGEEEEYFPADGISPPAKPKIERQGRNKNFVEKFTEMKINSTETSTLLKDLKPYTMYEIYLISVNGHGSSLPTYRMRALTLMPVGDEPKEPAPNSTLPDIPDVRLCCERQGLPMESCVNKFCDPRQTDEINLTDMMICAPWVSITIPCLTQGKDHTPCCVQRGLPALCLNLCHGNITRIDYQYFQCLPYMDIYANCLMEGYGVLTSAPKDLTIQHVSHNYAVMHWMPPETYPDTVVSYNIHYRPLSDEEGDGFYLSIPSVRSPYLLNKLLPNTNYETFVRAVNEYGVSQASTRVLFRTKKEQPVADTTTIATSPNSYNITDCCLQAGVAASCLPLCNFHARLSDVKDLVPACVDDMHKMLRCGAGGRNHVPCCEQRKVPGPCLELCAGVITRSATAVSSSCMSNLISIVECMEEGIGLLPAPVTDFHVINVNSTAVYAEWKPQNDSNVTTFEFFFEISKNEASRQSVRINMTSTVLNGLDSHETYDFYVLSVNEYGSSIASSLVHLNLSIDTEGDRRTGTTSPPEALSVRDRNATSMTIMWLPPAFTHPLDHLRYKLYYRTENQTIPNSLTTTSLGVQLNDLSSQTEYEIYVTALTDKGESPAAESVTAWTLAIIPAYVEIPHIHPSDRVAEGSNVSIMCAAMGTPTPLVSLFINGIIYGQANALHMVVAITNVSREMDTVVCYAENGHGPGMQSTKKMQINFKPSILTTESVTSMAGHSAVLSCIVSAQPEPRLTWSRDVNGKEEIVADDSHLISTIQEKPRTYSTHLTVLNATAQDGGYYHCHAKNPLGEMTKSTNLRVQPIPTYETSSVRECCIEQNVAPECMDACNYDVNIDLILTRSKCLPEINKLMFCAADGSDHRRCCLGWGVPRRCIGWCQGKAIHHGAMCTLVWSKQIISCFQEGKDLLPGPPQNIQIKQISNTEAKVTWDPPTKNPNTVDFYRVSWKKTSPDRMVKFHNETHDTSLTISNMLQDAIYELTIKAVNRRGSSSPSSPERIIMNGHVGSLDSISDSNGEQAGLAVGLVFALLVLGMVVALAYVHYRRHTRKATGGVSFENPSYMKDGTSDTVQITNAPETNGGPHSTDGWKSEALHAPDIPSSGHYEELRNESETGYKHSKDIL